MRVSFCACVTCVVAVLACSSGYATASDTLVLIGDTAGWEARVEAGGQNFEFTPENILLADEVSALPGNNVALGTVLTFRAALTGLMSDVVLVSTGSTPPTSWVFQDRGIPGILSPGDIDGFSDDDDVRVTFGTAPVYAFGIDFCDNTDPPVGETVTFFGVGGVVLGSVPLPQNPNGACDLLSVVSTVPIEAVEIDEEANMDDVYFRGFRVGTPRWCGLSDFALPFGVLDLADVDAFILNFGSSDPAADLAEPIGVFDLADIDAFITSFLGGCP